MNRPCRVLFVLMGLSLLTGGCAVTVDSKMNLVTDNTKAATLMVYREKLKFRMIGATLYVGTQDKYFFELANGGHSTISIDAGTHVLNYKIQGQLGADEVEVALEPGEVLCLLGAPSSSLSIGVGQNPTVNSKSGFYLKKTQCPTSEELSGLNG